MSQTQATAYLGDTDVVLESSGPIDEQHLAWFFGGPRPAGAEPAVRRLTVAIEPVSVPTDAADSTSGPIDRWDVGDVTIFNHRDGRAASATAERISLSASPESAGDPWRTCRQLLAESVAAWAARHGHILLHGALVSSAGRGVVVVGPTGAGKSTLVVAALLAGFDVHADDLVLIPAGNHPTAYGIPKPLTIERSLSERLPDVRWSAAPNDARGRVMVAEHQDLLVRSAAPVGSVVSPLHGTGRASLEPMTHAEALSMVAASSFEVTHGRVDAALMPIARTAGRPAYWLAHDSDVDRRLERAAELLERIVHEGG